MKKILLFRLLQLGSEWTPGDRQRNIFNVPRWGLMSTVQTHHRATSSAYHQWTAGTKWWRRTWNGQSLDWRAGSYTKTHIYWWSMTNRNSWQLLKCSTVCHSPYCTMLLFIARNATMFYLSLCLSVCLYACMFFCWQDCSETTDQRLYAMVSHNPQTKQFDFQWPWPKVKVCRDQKVKIVFTNNSVQNYRSHGKLKCGLFNSPHISKYDYGVGLNLQRSTEVKGRRVRSQQNRYYLAKYAT